MLKRELTYETFGADDEVEELTEDFFFNIAKHEVMEMESQKRGGYVEWIKEIARMDDNKTILEEFKKIILLAYGERSDDGRFFLKKDPQGNDLSAKFAQHAAFHVLYWKMMSDEDYAAEFFIGIFPREVADKIAADVAADKAKDQGTVKPPPVPPKV